MSSDAAFWKQQVHPKIIELLLIFQVEIFNIDRELSHVFPPKIGQMDKKFHLGLQNDLYESLETFWNPTWRCF